MGHCPLVMNEQQTGSGEFSRVDEPVMLVAGTAPVTLLRIRVGQFDVELWDESDGLVIDRATGERHRCTWSVESNDEHSVIDFYCRALPLVDNRAIIRAMVDATIIFADGTEVRVDTCRAI